MIDQIRDVYAYNAWANGRILDTAQRLDPAALLEATTAAGSIRDILVHTAWAHWIWLERWQGESPRVRWAPEDFSDLPALRARWGEVERDTARYLADVNESDLGREIAYANFAGETWRYPLWQALMHQVNHATQHRSEAALLLTEAGHSPGDLDFLRYFDALA